MFYFVSYIMYFQKIILYKIPQGEGVHSQSRPNIVSWLYLHTECITVLLFGSDAITNPLIN